MGGRAGGSKATCLEEGCLAEGVRRKGGSCGGHEKMKNKNCAEIKKERKLEKKQKSLSPPKTKNQQKNEKMFL